MKLPATGSLSARSVLSNRIRSRSGFTIVELLASTAILAIILAIIFGITQQISNAWKKSSAKIEAFQSARGAFGAMTRQISQATLNTYYDYYDASGNRRGSGNSAAFTPFRYGRYSDLHFISGGWSSPANLLVPGQVTQAIFFQAPMGYATAIGGVNYGGMETLLNACGYYIVYSKDNTRPQFLDDSTLINKLPDRYRFRLMQFIQPSESMTVYDTSGSGTNWFKTPLSANPPSFTRIMAENIIALVIRPKRSASEEVNGNFLAPDFEYNSRPSSIAATQAPADYQLPPVVEIVMVAIDEPSAQKFCTGSSMPDFGLSGGLGGLFKKVTDLEDSGGNPGDIAKLSKALDVMHVGYRVFRTQVAIRGSKWSDQ